MTTGIRLVADRGLIVVGDTAFRGGTITGGGLSIDGHAIRPLTLAERDELVALATMAVGESTARELAHLVGAAAADDLRQLPDATRVALEAVALHLAGASMSGPLARTALLVNRSVGPSAGAMAAIEADRLAAALAEGLMHGTAGAHVQRHDDAGWTTLSYSAPSHSDAAASDASSVVGVRDALAEALLDRAAAPLEPELAERLVGIGRPGAAEIGGDPWFAPSTHEASAVRIGHARSGATSSVAGGDRRVMDRWTAADELLRVGSAGAVSDEEASGSRRDAGPALDRRDAGPALDRWSAAVAPATPIDRWPAVGHEPIAAGSATTHSVPPPVVAASWPPDGAWRAAPSAPWRRSPRPSIGPGSLASRAGPAVPHAQGHAPSDPVTSAMSTVPFAFRPRLAGGTFDAPMRATADVETAGWLPRPAGEAIDLDATAQALHRAADLRGLPR